MKRILFIAAALAVAACNYYERKAGPDARGNRNEGGGGPPPPVVSSRNDVQAPMVRYGLLRERIFAPLCLECHNPVTLKGDLDLSTVEGARAAVVAGRPDESPLFLRPSANEMPPARRIPPLRHLSPEEKALVRSWIEGGTPE